MEQFRFHEKSQTPASSACLPRFEFKSSFPIAVRVFPDYSLDWVHFCLFILCHFFFLRIHFVSLHTSFFSCFVKTQTPVKNKIAHPLIVSLKLKHRSRPLIQKKTRIKSRVRSWRIYNLNLYIGHNEITRPHGKTHARPVASKLWSHLHKNRPPDSKTVLMGSAGYHGANSVDITVTAQRSAQLTQHRADNLTSWVVQAVTVPTVTELLQLSGQQLHLSEKKYFIYPHWVAQHHTSRDAETAKAHPQQTLKQSPPYQPIELLHSTEECSAG